MSKRVIITGGGTGGHIFPAISIANALKKMDPTIEILFVGAEGGMEMRVVPQYGYKIEGVKISGLMRSFSLKNILKNMALPFKLIGSLMKSGRIIRDFKPQVVVGVGGYASGPVGRAAAKRGIPVVLCEQNAYPGITNKILAQKAARILLGNEAAQQYFDKTKSKVTGNPVRETLLNGDRVKGLAAFNLDGSRPVVLSLGGSLGAGTLNAAWEAGWRQLADTGIQLVWQCGKRYYDALKERLPEHTNLRLAPFIEDMASAYAAADLVVTRAGGSTISELILLNKPAILIPSPNVAEDHQTKNARSLTDRGAAILVKDVEAKEKLAGTVMDILQHQDKLNALLTGIVAVEKHDSAKEIATEILSQIKMNGHG
jgi:UDP-N-acetylglucosamine--N-acetylmuramyl-(pentapeptide) pyrophosphoryl-undecaprenol N-acetylglucosamine transferase